jgi:hypothetical protein
MRYLSQAERDVVRGRKIVARQRELVARFGEQMPIAVALLQTFEGTLAQFENILAGQRQEIRSARACHSGAADTTTALELNHQEQISAVA